jgi:lysophospholipase L1-like esterase
MSTSDNDMRRDDRQDQSGETAGATIFSWVFRLLRALLRRGGQAGGRAVVTGTPPGPGQAIVACLGASATDAAGSYDWIADLARRPENASLRFYRFAEGGDLAYNGLQRVSAISAIKPDYVIVLLGENDVVTLIAPKHAQFVRLTKHLPAEPSPQWFRETMQTVVRRLKSETQAVIALCSLIPIGEDPNSANPFQAEANRRIEEYSSILKEIAREEAVGYIPLYERMHEFILASPGRAFTSFDFLPFYRDVFRQFVLRKSHDEIGRLNGWRFHRDGIHLNSRSGTLLADLAQEFLNTTTSGDNCKEG